MIFGFLSLANLTQDDVLSSIHLLVTHTFKSQVLINVLIIILDDGHS
jgi:hypothetical protein